MAKLQQRIESFIEKAKIIHKGEKYDYSKVYETYKNNRTNVCIVDHSLKQDGTEYGEFWITPSNLLKGHKNRGKRDDRISKSKQMSQEEFIKRCLKVHEGENLDYSNTIYNGMHKPIYVIDHSLKPDGTEYGGYWQEASSHLKGSGHPDKAIYKNSLTMRSNSEDFIVKSMAIHDGKGYGFDKVKYTRNKDKVIITCPIHGDFEISPDNFLSGKGCPSCGKHLSKCENEIYEFVCNIVGAENVKRRDRTLLNGKEVDIVIPSKKLGIEYNGVIWHSEKFGKDRNYHLNKLNVCKEKGYSLIQIFEDEYTLHKDIVQSKLRHMLGGDNDLPRIMGRKCCIQEIPNNLAKDFLNQYHIQGFSPSTIYLGAFYKDELIAVMTFKIDNNEKNTWNLTRFASNNNYLCQGIGGKIFKYFINIYSPNEVKTFLDRRWEWKAENNIYAKIGFTFDSIIPPNYTYTDGHSKRMHKFGFRKNIVNAKYGIDKSLTEREMADKLNLFRVWDCGLIRYTWKASKHT